MQEQASVVGRLSMQGVLHKSESLTLLLRPNICSLNTEKEKPLGRSEAKW